MPLKRAPIDQSVLQYIFLSKVRRLGITAEMVASSKLYLSDWPVNDDIFAAIAHIIQDDNLSPSQALEKYNGLTEHQQRYMIASLRTPNFKKLMASPKKKSRPRHLYAIGEHSLHGKESNMIAHFVRVRKRGGGERIGLIVIESNMNQLIFAIEYLMQRHKLSASDALQEVAGLSEWHLRALITCYGNTLRGKHLAKMPSFLMNEQTYKLIVYLMKEYHLTGDEVSILCVDESTVDSILPAIDYLMQHYQLSAANALNEVTDLTKWQLKTLLACYANGLRKHHLDKIDWQNFDKSKYNLLVYLINEKKISIDEAVHEAKGLQVHDAIAEAVLALWDDGLRKKTFKEIFFAKSGRRFISFSQWHKEALIYLVKEKQLSCEVAMHELVGLSTEKAYALKGLYDVGVNQEFLAYKTNFNIAEQWRGSKEEQFLNEDKIKLIREILSRKDYQIFVSMTKNKYLISSPEQSESEQFEWIESSFKATIFNVVASLTNEAWALFKEIKDKRFNFLSTETKLFMIDGIPWYKPEMFKAFKKIVDSKLPDEIILTLITQGLSHYSDSHRDACFILWQEDADQAVFSVISRMRGIEITQWMQFAESKQLKFSQVMQEICDLKPNERNAKLKSYEQTSGNKTPSSFGSSRFGFNAQKVPAIQLPVLLSDFHPSLSQSQFSP